MSTSDDTPGDLESVRKRLNVVTQETRFSLLQDILGHPSELPTLNFSCPRIAGRTIYRTSSTDQ